MTDLQTLHRGTASSTPEATPLALARLAEPKRIAFLIGIFGVLLTVGLVGLAGAQEAERQIGMSFFRQPTPYTELYFDDVEQLPPSHAADHSSTFRFTVRNHDIRITAYRYVATLVSGGRAVQLGTGNFALKKDQAESRAVTLPAIGLGVRFVVSVALAGTNDSIDFMGAT